MHFHKLSIWTDDDRPEKRVAFWGRKIVCKNYITDGHILTVLALH